MAASAGHEFSIRVKSIRLRLDITQEDLAKTLGVSFATVNRWENGKTKPSKLAQNQFEQFCLNHDKENG